MTKRDLRLKTSVSFNVVLKAVNLVINFALVPVLIVFFGKKNYGLWVTIYAFVNWFNIFDVGLGQGLKLKLTQAFSAKKVKDIKKIISSAYYFVAVISISLLFLAILSTYFLNWSSFFDVEGKLSQEVNHSLLILLVFFLLIFVVKLIGVIYASLQFTFLDNLIKTLGQLIFLGAIILVVKCFEINSKLLFASLLSILPVFLIYLAFNVYFFVFKTPSLIPRVKNISKQILKDIVTPGFSFFVIQIGYIILYSTDNFIILNLVSEEAVADYSIYYKYYSIPFLFYSIYINSHWSSFIDALTLKDHMWIKKKIRFFNFLFLGLILAYIILFTVNDSVFDIWIGKGKISKDLRLELIMISYYLVSSYITNYIYVINAYGKLRIQLISYVVIALINIPLSIFFVNHFKIGSSGVILASTVCLFILLVLMPIQYKKIVNCNLHGIWNK